MTLTDNQLRKLLLIGEGYYRATWDPRTVKSLVDLGLVVPDGAGYRATESGKFEMARRRLRRKSA